MKKFIRELAMDFEHFEPYYLGRNKFPEINDLKSRPVEWTPLMGEHPEPLAFKHALKLTRQKHMIWLSPLQEEDIGSEQDNV